MKDETVSNQNLVSTFEHEFQRILTPLENEIVLDWLEKGFSETKIRDALKEAVYNGKLGFKYINKILDSWNEEKEPHSVTESDLPW